MIDLSTPKIMGILNVTPDSFSDGGKFLSLDAALQQAAQMHQDGADIIDVGGESTRPGAAKVSEGEELDRVIPVIEKIASELPVHLSVDTMKPVVMGEAVSAGATLVNDVNALQAEGAVSMVASLGVQVCLMHMQGTPQTMQANPSYSSVVNEVKDFLQERCRVCEQSGIARENILLDPGFGFGKTVDQNYELFGSLTELQESGYPVLVGVSRKSMIGAIIESEPEERIVGSVVLAAMALERGAMVLRVHDVRETYQALTLVNAVLHAQFNQD